ncbi:hypothetical protein FRC11_009226 [Ceratobasidium sp. 423]|nr:hypothetical protein FRC11_009226 [Ceratobasidium sp. 423]
MLSKTLSLVVLGLAAVANVASGHPGENHALPRAELHRRQLEANKRHIVARNCAPQIAEFNAKRKAKRALARRSVEPVLNGRHFRRQQPQQQGRPGANQGQQGQQGDGQNQQGQGQPGNQASNSFSRSFSGSAFPTTAASSVSASATIIGFEPTVIAAAISTTSTSSAVISTSVADSPTYSTIQNSTCVTIPELTEGPYYVNNELLRQDIRGIKRVLNLSSISVSWTSPLARPSSRHSLRSGTATHCRQHWRWRWGQWYCPGGNMTVPTGTESMSLPTGTESMSAMRTGGAGGGGGGSTSMTDQESFLRGGYATNSEDMVEFFTTYPGFYTGRTVHIHTMIHTNYSVATNGSIISHAGNVRHIGQLFFDDELNEKIL